MVYVFIRSQKTDEANPKWFMVDVTFGQRASNYVSLSLLKRIAADSPNPPQGVEYIGEDGVKAIKGMVFCPHCFSLGSYWLAMALLNRGRLSVQPVEEEAFMVIQKLAETGGWEDTLGKTDKGKKKGTASGPSTKKSVKGDTKVSSEDVEKADEPKKTTTQRKRKAADEGTSESIPLRRSTRSRK